MADLPVIQLDDMPTVTLDSLPDVNLDPEPSTFNKVIQNIAGRPAGLLTAATTLVGGALSPAAGLGTLFGGGSIEDAYKEMGNFMERSRFQPINPVAESQAQTLMMPIEGALKLAEPLLKESGKVVANSPLGGMEQALSGRTDISKFTGELAPLFMSPAKVSPVAGTNAAVQMALRGAKTRLAAMGMEKLAAPTPTDVQQYTPSIKRRRQNTPVQQMEQTSIEGIPTVMLDKVEPIIPEAVAPSNAGQAAFEFIKPEDTKIPVKGDVPDFVPPTAAEAPVGNVFMKMPDADIKAQAKVGVEGAKVELARREALKKETPVAEPPAMKVDEVKPPSVQSLNKGEAVPENIISENINEYVPPGKPKFAPALRVDGTIYKDGLNHGEVLNSIPSDKVKGAKNIESGYVDESGKWFSDEEALATLEPPKVEEPVPPAVPDLLPDYIREEMLRRGLNPSRVLNDVDLNNKSVIEALKLESPEKLAKEGIVREGDRFFYKTDKSETVTNPPEVGTPPIVEENPGEPPPVPKRERSPLAENPIEPDPLDVAPAAWTEPLVEQSVQRKRPLSPAAQLFKERYEAAKKAKAEADMTSRRQAKLEKRERVAEPEDIIDKQLDESLTDEWNRKLAEEGMPEELPTENLDILESIESGDTIPDRYSTDRGRASLDFDTGFMGSQMAQHLYEASRDAIIRNPSVQNMVRLAKTSILDGVKSFGEFRTKARQVLGDTWDSVSASALKAWNAAKSWNDKIGDTGFAETRKSKEQRAIEKAQREANKTNIPGPNIVKQLTGEDGLHRTLYGAPNVNKGMFKRLLRAWGDDLYKYEGTPAEPLIAKAIDAQSVEAHNIGVNKTALDDIASVTKLEQENVRAILEGGTPISPAAQVAAGKTRAWLDGMRARYQDHLLNEYQRNLKPNEFNAVVDILKGESWLDTSAKYKVDHELLGSLVKRVDDIQKWGLDDYIPNVELGSIVVVDGKGDVAFYASSSVDAGRKAADYWQTNPTAGNLHMVDNPNIFAELRTGISGKQYHALANKLAKEMMAQAEELTKEAAKQMSYRAMEGNFKINPPKVFSEFTIPRRNVLSGEKNIIPVLHKYSRIMEKKMAYDPVIADVQKAINSGKMDSVMVGDLQNIIKDIKGEYTKADKMIDAAFREIYGKVNEKFGTELEAPTFTYTRSLGSVRTVNANAKLGYRLVATGVNRASGALHIITKTGVQLYREGRQFLKTPEGMKLIKEVEDRLGSSIVDEAGDVRATTEMWKPLGTFQAVEAINRPEAIAANYLLAKKLTPSITHEAAREFAVRANGLQNFIYNTASIPSYMRGPLGKTLLQFKPYLIKELEFISTLKGAEIPRYITGMLMIGGPRAFVATLKSLPILGAFYGFDRLEEVMNKHFPKIARGLPGIFAGIDVAASAAIQFPASTKDWVGPVFSPILDLIELAGKRAQGIDVGAGDFVKAGTVDQIVIAKNLMESIKLAIDGDGWVKDNNGNKQYNVYDTADPVEKVLGIAEYATKRVALGATPIAQSRAQLAERIDNREDIVAAENKKITIRKLVEHFKANKEIPQVIWENVEAYKINGTSIRNSAMFKELDPRTRRLLETELARRAEMLEMYPTEEEMINPSDLVIPSRRNRFAPLGTAPVQ